MPGAQKEHMFLVTMRGRKRKLELILLGSKSNKFTMKLTHATEHITAKHEGEDERVSLYLLHYGSAFHTGWVVTFTSFAVRGR